MRFRLPRLSLSIPTTVLVLALGVVHFPRVLSLRLPGRWEEHVQETWLLGLVGVSVVVLGLVRVRSHFAPPNSCQNSFLALYEHSCQLRMSGY